ncbi:MAG: hypothetical protein M3P26_10555 [Gemmatimonadota bacterium]|nr:hypothetical protein [Gemmatimonadota bacterium]
MSEIIVPPERPKITIRQATELIRAHGINGPALLGQRGYYRDRMGVVGKNDRGIYDDMIAIVTPDFFKAWNANTDPSRQRPGIAVLRAGVWDYKLGIHNISKDPTEHPHYEALVQAEVVRVLRDGGRLDVGFFGINIHKGGYTTTSSEGCQTIYPDQWPDFIGTVKREMARLRISVIPYVLTERGEDE